jgi:hypothetical protein
MKKIGNFDLNQIKEVLQDEIHQNLYVAIVKGEKVCDLDPNTAAERIKQLINKTLAERKFSYDSDELQFLTVTVIKDILSSSRMSCLTLQEIEWCFYYGIRGEFGEYMGVSGVTFYQWLKHYLDKKKPLINKAVFKLENKTDSKVLPDKKLGEENKELIIKEYLCSRYDDIQSFGADEFDDFGNVIYNWLYKQKLLPDYTYDEKEFIRGDAEIIYLSRIRNSNHDLFLKGRNIQTIDINAVMKSLEGEDFSSHKKAIDVEAKKIVVRLYFKSLFSNEELRLKFENSIGYDGKEKAPTVRQGQ